MGVCGAGAAKTSDSLLVPLQHFSHICFPSADNNGVGFPTNACIQIDTQTIRVAHSAPVFAVNSLSRNDIASVATA